MPLAPRPAACLTKCLRICLPKRWPRRKRVDEPALSRLWLHLFRFLGKENDGVSSVALRPLGKIVRLQIQRSPLKIGEKPSRVYDPSPILAVAGLTLTPQRSEEHTSELQSP